MSTNIITFFEKFYSQNFDTRRIFYEKLICGIPENEPKMTLDPKKSDFLMDLGAMRPISLKTGQNTYRQLM